MFCKCVDSAVEIVGLCDPLKIVFEDVQNPKDRNWSEISIPEVLTLPCQKPNIESIDKVYIKVKIISKRIIATPVGTKNEEGTKLTGKKMLVEGILCQKIVYTAAVCQQSVHSAHFNVPFSTFIVLNPEISLTDTVCIETCIEDVFVKAVNCRQIFKNVTLFLRAKLAPPSPCHTV
ncbi:MAG: DUF3794 domain-containing protein [Clostridiales bacterium]|nr:DUF3794 domain-containing protein [Clostridiales bacterium]